MPVSLSFVLVHIIFSTKDREPILDTTVLPKLHAYLATTAREAGCDCFRAGGIADHVHPAIHLSRTTSLAELVEALKSSSSKWLKTQSPTLEKFSWQRGYGAFSVGPGDLAALTHYIDTQAAHHQKYDFKEEFLALLKKYGIEYDERYLWD